MNLINFQLVTPEKTLLSQEMSSLTCPTELGQITILPGHVPLVANLLAGEVHGKTEGKDYFLYVSGGFIEVKTGNKIVLLADSAEHAHEIDIKDAEEAVERAKKTMAEEKLSSHEYAQVAASLERGLSRVRIARKHAPKNFQSNFSDTNTEK